MTVAYIALGANLGDPVATLRAALPCLDEIADTRRIATSSLYRTAPVGLVNQPDFINAVAAVETTLSASDLMTALFAIEARFGRSRSYANAPRTLDLDLLLHGDGISANPYVTLPHPRMHLRAFVLRPLVEIAPALNIPGRGSAADLLAGCNTQITLRLADPSDTPCPT